jgi:hypothetical protein
VTHQSARRSTPPESGSTPRQPFDYYLQVDHQELPLRPGSSTVGRSIQCDVRIDSVLISRQHARISVRHNEVTIQDLSSRNGVFVNDVLIRRAVPLEVDDEIRIGDRRLRLVARERRDSERRQTLGDLEAVRPAAQPPIQTGMRRSALPRAPETPASPGPSTIAPDQYDESTTRADAMDLLGIIVDRAVAAGDIHEAEALVSGHLAVLLSDVKAHRRLKPEACESAARQALKLATSTQKGAWVDYIFELYLTSGQPMPLSIVHELFNAASHVRVTQKPLVGRYLQFLRGHPRQKSEEQLVVQRLERYERL